MARSIGTLIPEQLGPLLDGSDPDRWVGTTILLLTATPDGWPHLAMLSVGEVVMTGPRHLYLALWPNSTATANLTHGDRATLALVHESAGYYLRCRARREDDLPVPGYEGAYACMALEVEDVQEDTAPYAVLTSGVTFRLNDPPVVLKRWRATITALKERASHMPATEQGG